MTEGPIDPSASGVAASATLPPTVSVVVCAYTEDRWDDIVAAIESVQAQDPPPLEVVLVVDHSPALLERARAAFPGVEVIENTDARGLPGARNTGIRATRGDVIAFLDDDARARPGWLSALAAPYADPDVLGVGGHVEALWPGERPRWFPTEFDWVIGCTFRGGAESRKPVRNMIGANMSIRRAVFEAVGGFRPELGRIGTRPVGCEETELCIRARQHWPQGYFLHEPAAAVLHRQVPSRARWSYYWRRCYSEGLSKAVVSQLVGSRDGLSSERDYTFRVLPAGVLHGLRDVVLRRDASGAGRSAAIVIGLLTTTAGYAVGRVRGAARPRARSSRVGPPVTSALPE